MICEFGLVVFAISSNVLGFGRAFELFVWGVCHIIIWDMGVVLISHVCILLSFIRGAVSFYGFGVWSGFAIIVNG
jgi:hypothetical protein